MERVSIPWIVQCRDCGQRFRATGRDQVMCLPCLFQLMAEDEPDGDPRSEYAEEIAALPAAERRRLLTNKWSE
jgi:hypothetical protein